MGNDFVNFFIGLTDPRTGNALKYEMEHIVARSILGIMCGAVGPTDIGIFIKENFDVLQVLFPNDWKRHPVISTVHEVVNLVDFDEFDGLLRKHAHLLNLAMGGGEGDLLAADGKDLRHSFDNAADKASDQLVRIMSITSGLILAHIAIVAKSNEIPALRKLIEQLEIRGYFVTADALHDNEETVKAIKTKGGEAIIQVKDNQPKLRAAMTAVAAASQPVSSWEDKGKKTKHNRMESRTYEVFPMGTLLNLQGWDGTVMTGIRVTRVVWHRDTSNPFRWKKSEEVSWYMSTSSSHDVMVYAFAIRGHWFIETKVHHPLDCAMGEDASRIRKAAGIYSIMRSFALNLLRFNGVTNIAQALWQNVQALTVQKAANLLALPVLA